MVRDPVLAVPLAGNTAFEALKREVDPPTDSAHSTMPIKKKNRQRPVRKTPRSHRRGILPRSSRPWPRRS